MRHTFVGVAVTGFSFALSLEPACAESQAEAAPVPAPALNSLRFPSTFDQNFARPGSVWAGLTSASDPFGKSPSESDQPAAAPGPAWAMSKSVGDPFRNTDQRGLRKSTAPDGGFTGFHLSGSKPSRRNVPAGWTAYGAFGPIRFVNRLDDPSSKTTWRFGGRPPGMPTAAEAPLGLPKNYRIGVIYRF